LPPEYLGYSGRLKSLLARLWASAVAGAFFRLGGASGGSRSVEDGWGERLVGGWLVAGVREAAREDVGKFVGGGVVVGGVDQDGVVGDEVFGQAMVKADDGGEVRPALQGAAGKEVACWPGVQGDDAGALSSSQSRTSGPASSGTMGWQMKWWIISGGSSGRGGRG